MAQMLHKLVERTKNLYDLGELNMINNCGLQREKIKATIYKKPVAQSMALIIDTIQKSITSDCDDFWVGLELNVNIKYHKVADKHMAVDTYVSTNGQSTVPPEDSHRVRVSSCLSKQILVLPWAQLVKTLEQTVQAEQEEFWVRVDAHIHMVNGQSKEKKVRVNVFGDLVDDYCTTIIDVPTPCGVPEEVLTSLCDDFNDQKSS